MCKNWWRCECVTECILYDAYLFLQNHFAVVDTTFMLPLPFLLMSLHPLKTCWWTISLCQYRVRLQSWCYLNSHFMLLRPYKGRWGYLGNLFHGHMQSAYSGILWPLHGLNSCHATPAFIIRSYVALFKALIGIYNKVFLHGNEWNSGRLIWLVMSFSDTIWLTFVGARIV